MNVYLHDMFFESHRKPDRQYALVGELKKLGVEVHARPAADVKFDLVVCGGGQVFQSFKEMVKSYRGRLKGVPVCHYLWDLYPWQYGPNRPKPRTPYEGCQEGWWIEYAADIEAVSTKLILVPNQGTKDRCFELLDRGATVVHPAANFFDPLDGVTVGNDGYVLQSMRDYEYDPSAGLLDRACADLGVRLEKVDGSRSPEEFKRLVCRAAVLVSPFVEASTGGLMLLEGYRLGKPVFVYDSKLNGATEYFECLGDDELYWRACPFSSDRDIKLALMFAVSDHEYHPQSDCKEWAETNYSDAAFARRLVDAWRTVV